jgi:hypothetical protein
MAHVTDYSIVTTFLASSGSPFPILVITLALSVIIALTMVRVNSRLQGQQPLMIEPIDLRERKPEDERVGVK